MRSNTKKAKQIIRSEIRSVYSPKNYGEGRSTIDNMKRNADSYNAGQLKEYRLSDWKKGAGLVDAACFAIGVNQNPMLYKIYGKKKVEAWDYYKRHDVYKNLIGREYAAMLRERDAKKDAKKSKAKKITKKR